MINESTKATHAKASSAELAAKIVMVYVANNVLPASSLPGLIRDVRATLADLGSAAAPAAAVEPSVEKPTPAAIKKSITQEALISFIDGQPYKMLKRHLGHHGLDPYSYRTRYGLPADYPMTAPNYSERRSALARSNGLGRPHGGQQEASEAAE